MIYLNGVGEAERDGLPRAYPGITESRGGGVDEGVEVDLAMDGDRAARRVGGR
jgi:hypothetical protein